MRRTRKAAAATEITGPSARGSIEMPRPRGSEPVGGRPGVPSDPGSRFARLKARAATRRIPAKSKRGARTADRPPRRATTSVRRTARQIRIFGEPIDSGMGEFVEQTLPPADPRGPKDDRRDDGHGREDERDDARPGHEPSRGRDPLGRPRAVLPREGGPGEEPRRGG